MLNQALLTLTKKDFRLALSIGAISIITICSMILDNNYSIVTNTASVKPPISLERKYTNLII